jgi:hypothetical protein
MEKIVSELFLPKFFYPFLINDFPLLVEKEIDILQHINNIFFYTVKALQLRGNNLISTVKDCFSLCFRDVLIIGVVDAVTCLLAGFAIFSILGFLAYDQDKDVEEVIKEGKLGSVLCVGYIWITEYHVSILYFMPYMS